MIAKKRLAANRQNAKKSTGPKTAAGKARSRFNAVKHGLTAREVVIPGEDEEAFQQLHELLLAELAPEGILEAMLVDRVAVGFWRLRRIVRVEAGIFAWNRYKIDLKRTMARTKDYQLVSGLEHLNPLSPSEHKVIMAMAKNIEEQMQGEVPTLGLAFLKDALRENALSKLTRYETAAQRALYQALHEFQRLQAARGKKTELAPVALDISLDVGPGDPSLEE